MFKKYSQSSKFNPKKVCGIDTETTGVDPWGPRVIRMEEKDYVVQDQVFMAAMSDENGNTWCCNWPVDPYTRNVTPNQEDIDFICEILSIPGLEIPAQNTKFDYQNLNNTSKKIGELLRLASKEGRLHDTLFQARVCNTLELVYGLKYLSKKYLGINDDDEKDLRDAVHRARRYALKVNKAMSVSQNVEDRQKRIIRGSEVEEDYWMPHYFDKENKLCELYCRKDAVRTTGLHLFFQHIMKDDPYLRDTYRMEMNSIWPIVNKMEERSVRIFPEILREELLKCIEASKGHLAAMHKIVEEEVLEPFTAEQWEKWEKANSMRTIPTLIFNPASTPQLFRVLYLPREEGGLGITPQYARKGKNAGKSYTADKDALREMMYEPFVQELIGFRNAKNARSLFFDKMKPMIRPDKIQRDAYTVHISFNQCGTKTGRFSGGGEGGFNAQQISAGGKKSLGGTPYSSQKVFGPREDYLWLGFDYSQQEALIFGHIAQVKIILDAVKSKQNIFKAMADSIWGGFGNNHSTKAVVQALDLFREPSCKEVAEAWKLFEWNKKIASKVKQDDPLLDEIAEQWLSMFSYSIVEAERCVVPGNNPKEPVMEKSRQRCKHITYAKIFGGGPGSYTHLMYCTLEEAKEFDLLYNESMPELRKYSYGLSAKAKKDGYIINLYGRKLRVDPNFAYRAVSYMVQGTAASMMKSSMIKVDDFLTRLRSRYKKGIGPGLIATIHDEIKVECPIVDYNIALVRNIAAIMEDTQGVVGIHIPVECAVCRTQWSVNEEKVKIW